MSQGRRWYPNELIVVRELYHVYGTCPPGHKENIVLGEIASKLGRTRASIYKRLHNYAACDPDTKVRGLVGGGPEVTRFFNARFTHRKEYLDMLAKARKHFGLQGVI